VAFESREVVAESWFLLFQSRVQSGRLKQGVESVSAVELVRWNS
jgi:hypothetical protein